jgi:hypothetical protein
VGALFAMTAYSDVIQQKYAACLFGYTACFQECRVHVDKFRTLHCKWQALFADRTMAGGHGCQLLEQLPARIHAWVITHDMRYAVLQPS